MGANLVLPTSLLAFACYLRSQDTIYKTFFIIVLILSSISLMLYAFFSSSRAMVMVFFIGIWGVFSISGRRFSLTSLLAGFMLMTLIGTLMTSIRMSDTKELSELEVTKFFTETTTKLIVNNGGVDIQKLQLLIDHVREKGDYRYGEFSSNFVYMAVPRSLWPSKPVNIDTEFGMQVYGATSYGTGGVPPGILGEFFWDFSWLGLMLACILTSLILASLDKFLVKYKQSLFVIIAFSSSLFWTGNSLLGSGLSSYIIGSLMIILPLSILFIILNLISKSR